MSMRHLLAAAAALEVVARTAAEVRTLEERYLAILDGNLKRGQSRYFLPPNRKSALLGAVSPEGTGHSHRNHSALMNANRSALIVSACVVGIPCGKPL